MILIERENERSRNGAFGSKQKIILSGKGARKIQTVFDWDGFKKKEFAVLCEANKEQFFDDCERNGIHCFLSEFSKKRNLFVCCHLYEDRFSNGRYELAALKGWETKPNRLYGKDGLQEVKYEID